MNESQKMMQKIMENNGEKMSEPFSMDEKFLQQCYENDDMVLIQEAMKQMPMNHWLTFSPSKNAKVLLDRDEGVVFSAENGNVMIKLPNNQKVHCDECTEKDWNDIVKEFYKKWEEHQPVLHV